MATPPDIRAARQRIATIQQELRTNQLFETMVNIERAKIKIRQLEEQIATLLAPTPRVSVALSPNPTTRQQQQQLLRDIRNIDDDIAELQNRRRPLDEAIARLMNTRSQLEIRLDRLSRQSEISIGRKRIKRRYPKKLSGRA